MRSVLSTLACLLLCALPVCAITEEEIIQAVRDFEQDQSLAVTAVSTDSITTIGHDTEASASQASASVTYASGVYERHYMLLNSNTQVLSVVYYDHDQSVNPSIPSNPISVAQARALAEAFAASHHPGHGNFQWEVEQVPGISGGTCFWFYRVLPNGARADVGSCDVEVSLGTGQVLGYHQDITSLAPNAGDPPDKTAGEAEAAALAEFPGIAGHQLTTTLEVNYDGLLVYKVMPQYAKGELAESMVILPAYVEVDANTGEVVYYDFWKHSAAPPAGSQGAREPASTADWLEAFAVGAAILLGGLLLLFILRKRDQKR